MLEGKYTDAYLKDAGKDAPKFTDEELKIIASPLDFVGINVYKPTVYVLASDQAPGWRDIPFAKGHPKMSTVWLTVGPEALYWAPKLVQSLWNAKEIFITENGCATDDVLADDGKVYDTDRIMFLRACLTQLQRATADGVPVKGYFQWSTMDNFEWIIRVRQPLRAGVRGLQDAEAHAQAQRRVVPRGRQAQRRGLTGISMTSDSPPSRAQRERRGPCPPTLVPLDALALFRP